MEDRAERREVADATRRVIRAARVTQAPAEDLTAAALLLEEAAALLEADRHPGPHYQVGWGAPQFTPGSPPSAWFPFSPVLGELNPVSPKVELTVLPDGVVAGTMHLTEQYNGPPWNYGHGGVLAMVFDELLSIAAIVKTGGGMTGRLTVRYRKPTPILVDIELCAWLEHARGSTFVAKGEMRYDGIVTAEAEGLFVQYKGPIPAVEPAGTDTAGAGTGELPPALA